MDLGSFSRLHHNNVNYKKNTLISQIRQAKQLSAELDSKTKPTLSTGNIDLQTEENNDECNQNNLKDGQTVAAEENSGKASNGTYSFVLKKNKLLNYFKDRNKNQEESEIEKDVIKKPSSENEEKDVKRDKNEEAEEKEEESGLNGTTNEKEDNGNEQQVANKDCIKKEASYKKNSEIVEGSVVSQIQPSIGDLNNNEDSDYNHWYIKSIPPDKIKNTAINKVFLSRVKKSSAIKSQNENIKDKMKKDVKTTSLKNVPFENHKSDYTYEKVNKSPYTKESEPQRKGEKKEKRKLKRSYQNESSGKKKYFRTSHECVLSLYGSNFKQFDEPSENILKPQDVSKNYSQYTSSREAATELGNPLQRKINYLETNNQEIEKCKIKPNETSNGKEEWVVHSNPSSNSKENCGKYDETKLVLKKLKSHQTHTDKVLINNCEKEKNNMLRFKKETIANSPNNANLKTQEEEVKTSLHEVKSNCETLKFKSDMHKLDKKYHVENHNRFQPEQRELQSGVKIRSSELKSSKNTNYRITNAKIAKPKHKTERRRNPFDDLLSNNDRHSNKKLKHDQKATNIMSIMNHDIVRDKTSDVTDDEISSPMECDVTSLKSVTPVVMLEDIFASENGSVDNVENNLEIKNSKRKKVKPDKKNAQIDALAQFKTSYKIKVNNSISTRTSAETHKQGNKTNNVVHPTDKMKRKPGPTSECNNTTLKTLETSSKRKDHYRKISLDSKEHCKMTSKPSPQTQYVVLSTSGNVKNDGNVDQKPSLKVSIRLSKLGGNWLKHNVVHSENITSQRKTVNTKHKNCAATNESVDLNKQSQSHVQQYSGTVQLDEQAEHSNLVLENICSYDTYNINHRKNTKQWRIINSSTGSINNINSEGKVLDDNLNLQRISTEGSNTADGTSNGKLINGHSKETVLELSESSPTNEKIEKCNNNGKTCENYNKTNALSHLNNVHRKSMPFNIVNLLMLNEPSGAVEKGDGLKPHYSSVQIDKCKELTIQYKEVSSCSVKNDSSLKDVLNITASTECKSLINSSFDLQDDICIEEKTCFDEVELAHFTKESTSPNGYLTYGIESNRQHTVQKVEKDENTSIDGIEQPAKLQLISIAGNTNQAMKSFGTNLNLSIYKDFSSNSFFASKHIFDHFKFISNYISQRLKQKTTGNPTLFLLQNNNFSDVCFEKDVCFKKETSSLFPRGQYSNVEPFYGLKVKRLDVTENDTFASKPMIIDSSSMNNIVALTNNEIQTECSEDDKKPNNSSTFTKRVGDQFFYQTEGKVAYAIPENIDKKEQKSFTLSALKQNCMDEKSIDWNRIKGSDKNAEEIEIIFSKINHFYGFQQSSEQIIPSNSKRDLPINETKELFELDSHVSQSSQISDELQNKNNGECITTFPENKIYLRTDTNKSTQNSYKIINIPNTMYQLNEDYFQDSQLLTKHYQEETNTENAQTIFSRKPKQDDTDIPSKVIAKQVVKSGEKCNCEYKCNETEVNKTGVQIRDTCTGKSCYRSPTFNVDTSKEHLNDEDGNSEDVVHCDSDQKKQLRDDDAKPSISISDEETVVYVRNVINKNIVQENVAINDKPELQCSNHLQEVLTVKSDSPLTVTRQNKFADTTLSVSITNDRNFDRLISSTGKDTGIQLQINKVKQDFNKYYTLVFDRRIKYLCLKVGLVIYKTIKKEMDFKGTSPKECEQKSENCLSIKENNMSSYGNRVFTQKKTPWNYFVEFYKKISNNNIDASMQQMLLVAWFARVYSKVSKLSLLEHSLNLTKQTVLGFFPTSSHLIPIVADFIQKDEETLERQCSLVQKLTKDSSKVIRNQVYHTNKDNKSSRAKKLDQIITLDC